MALENPSGKWENPSEIPKVPDKTSREFLFLKSYTDASSSRDSAELLREVREVREEVRRTLHEYAKQDAERMREHAELLENYHNLLRELTERAAERTQEHSDIPTASRVTDLSIFKAQTEEFERGRTRFHQACDKLEKAVETMQGTEGSSELHAACDDLLAAMKTSRAAFDSVVVSHLVSDPQSANMYYIFISANDAAASTESAIEDVIDAQDDQSARNWIQQLGATVRKWLGKALEYLWRIITGLLTIKEWAIKGALSGTLAGLGPKAELEIKFGR